MDSDKWWHTTPEMDPRRCACFEMWGPCFPCGEHRYRIVLRGKSYDAEKNGKLIGQFAELEPAQRCIEASAQKGGGVAREKDGAGHGEDARSTS